MTVILTTNKLQGYCFILSPEHRLMWCRSWYSAEHCQTLVLFRFSLRELRLLTFSCLSDVSWSSPLLPPHGWATSFQNVWLFFFFLNNEKELKEILVIIYGWRWAWNKSPPLKSPEAPIRNFSLNHFLIPSKKNKSGEKVKGKYMKINEMLHRLWYWDCCGPENEQPKHSKENHDGMLWLQLPFVIKIYNFCVR